MTELRIGLQVHLVVIKLKEGVKLIPASFERIPLVDGGCHVINLIHVTPMPHYTIIGNVLAGHFACSREAGLPLHGNSG